MKENFVTPPQRSGATLIEVLMALMIMSIGVVSVATLFPLALKRAVQATQLTNSQILREQVIEMLRVNPELIPLNDRFAHDYSVKSGAGVTTKSLFPYGPNVPLTLWKDVEIVRIVDPLGVYEYADVAGVAGTGLMDAGDDLSYPLYATTFDDKINPRPAFNGMFADVKQIPVRLGGGWNRAQAFARVPLRDSWVTGPETTFIPVNTGPNKYGSAGTPGVLTDIGYPPTLDNVMSDLSTRITSDLRVMVFAENGRTSAMRSITSIDVPNRRIRLHRPLPDDQRFHEGNAVPFTSSAFQVRIQEFEQRYTWMLTTRTKLVGTEEARTHIDMALFFRRDFSPASETPHKLLYRDSQAIKPGRIQQNQRKFPYIILEPSVPVSAVDSGDWIFNYKRARWFQVREVISENIVTPALAGESASDGIKDADINKRIYQIELNDFDQSDEEGLDTNPVGEDVNSLKITIPRGVMQVYDLGETTQKLNVQ